jgi:uncharacterized membrane protein YjgN (DUF898 family)
VEFSGSGGEYFRVWIVNVLLSVVTLGFYTPFARRRYRAVLLRPHRGGRQPARIHGAAAQGW